VGDLFKELAGEASDLSNIPSEEGSRRLAKLGTELMQLDQRIEELTERLKTAQERHTAIRTRDMPALMEEVGQDRIGIPGVGDRPGVDLVLESYTHANISADWGSERREAGFREIVRAGGADIIKSTMVVLAGRREMTKMRRLAQRVQQMLAELELEASLEMRLDVQWNTLTSWLKEQLKAGAVLDLEKLGATVGSVVKIKQRRDGSAKKSHKE